MQKGRNIRPCISPVSTQELASLFNSILHTDAPQQPGFRNTVHTGYIAYTEAYMRDDIYNTNPTCTRFQPSKDSAMMEVTEGQTPPKIIRCLGP